MLAVALAFTSVSRVEASPRAQAEVPPVAFVSETTISAIRRFLIRYDLGTHLILFAGEVN